MTNEDDAASSEGHDSAAAAAPEAAGAAAGRWWDCCAAAEPMPLDRERKATRLRLLSCAAPHMRAFHLAWASHFVAVFATFAAAPLLPVIRDSLDLDKAQVSASGIAAVAGTVVARIITGGVCDRWGPRYAAAAIQLTTAAATFGMAAVANSAGFIAARFFIGCSMACFVSAQFWCSIMFTPRIVGTANAMAAGFGNSAGGFVQLLMPLLLQGLARSQPEYIAWRTCYFVVGWLQVLIGLTVLLLGQDMPAGNYAALKRQGSMPRSNTRREYLAAAKNYRTWVLTALYGFSFGVELTCNNVFAQYIYDSFETSLTRAGAAASIFGLVNLFSRPAGGWLSDRAAHRFGMRGRLWVLFGLQSSAAAFCCGLSRMGASLGGTMAMAACMAVALTAASGATFGIVPFITRRGLGAANGIVGSGSSVGSVLLQALFFTGNSIDYAQGFLLMGLTSLAASFLAFLLRWPMWGGMLPLPWGGCRPAAGASEEDYFAADFSKKERLAGIHGSVLDFAAESRSQRGMPSLRVTSSARSSNGGHDGDGGEPSSAAVPPCSPGIQLRHPKSAEAVLQ